MLWLARGLELRHHGQDDRLQRAIRANLAGWRRQIHASEALPPESRRGSGRGVQPRRPDRPRPAARTARRGSGTRPPAEPRRPTTGDTRRGRRPWRSAPTAAPSLTGERRRHGAAVGRGHRPSPVGPPLAHRGRVRAVAFSPDGQTVLTGEPGRDGAALGRGHRHEPRGQPLRHRLGLTPWRSAPTARPSLTGEQDGTARLWDAATGRAPSDGPSSIAAVRQRRGLQPRRPTVLTGDGTDGTARLWDAATGQPRGQPLRHTPGSSRRRSAPTADRR